MLYVVDGMTDLATAFLHVIFVFESCICKKIQHKNTNGVHVGVKVG